MKKKAIIVLCLALVFTLIGCGNNAQSSDEHNAEYEEGYTAGIGSTGEGVWCAFAGV